METTLVLALVMLALLAALPPARKVAARLRRDLPYCMEHDPDASWGDHQAGQCLCSLTKTDTPRSSR